MDNFTIVRRKGVSYHIPNTELDPMRAAREATGMNRAEALIASVNEWIGNYNRMKGIA